MSLSPGVVNKPESLCQGILVKKHISSYQGLVNKQEFISRFVSKHEISYLGLVKKHESLFQAINITVHILGLVKNMGVHNTFKASE